MDKLILFGGSFDPIHIGHLNIANYASKALKCKVCFIPAKISVWKETSVSKKEKMEMVELAIKNYPDFFVSDYEIESEEKYNYSYFTALHFKEMFPNTKLYFLIGSDHVNKFHLWKYAKELSEIVQILYFHRPGYEADINNIEKYHMLLIKGKEYDATSTHIRDLTIVELQEEILQYIEDHNLYYIPKVKQYFDNEKRYKHSLSVAHLAYQIAQKTKSVDSSKAYQAGLLHDIGKHVKGEKAMAIMKEHFSEYIDIGEWSYHQFIGSYIAENDFGIKDQSILNAIEFHATGNDKMDALGKIIYAADKIDPLREYDSQEMIKAMMENVDKGFKLVLKERKEYLENSGGNNKNRLTYSCYNKYLD